MPQQDRDFLAAYVRAQPSRGDKESLEDYLRRVKVDPGPPEKQESTEDYDRRIEAQFAAEQRNPQARKEQRDYERAQVRDAAAAKLAAEQEARKQQARNADLIGKGLYAAGIGPNKAADAVERARAWLANLPTPGGNGALLLVLLGFVAFIVPVSGAYTRAQLFWLSLLGRTSLTDSQGSEPAVHPTTAPDATVRPVAAPEPAVQPAALAFTLPMPGTTGPTLPSALK